MSIFDSSLVAAVKNANYTISIIGHGSRGGMDKVSLECTVVWIVGEIGDADNIHIITFGDPVNFDRPDVGLLSYLVYQKLVSMGKEVHCSMIQIDKYKEYGAPVHIDIDKTYYHNDYVDGGDYMYGGVVNGTPFSNSKQFFLLHSYCMMQFGRGIDCLYVAGGGEIALQEMKHADSIGMTVKYYPTKNLAGEVGITEGYKK